MKGAAKLSAFAVVVASVGLFLAGCEDATESEAQQGVQMDSRLLKKLRGMIAGEVTEVNLAGQVIRELPADFQLNPSLTSYKERLARGEFDVVIAPKIGLFLSRRIVEGHMVKVFVGGAIDAGSQPGVYLLIHTQGQNDVGEGQNDFGEGDFFSKGQNNPVVLVVNKDGRLTDEFRDDWAFAVVVMRDKGVVCWSAQGNDQSVRPYTSGFWRFIIRPTPGRKWPDGPSRNPLWLDPLPPGQQ